MFWLQHNTLGMVLIAGMTNSGGPQMWLGTANWHGGFCHAPTPTPARDEPQLEEVSWSAIFVPMMAAGMPLSGDKTPRDTLLFRPACWIRVD